MYTLNVTLKSKYGIPFPLPTEEKKLRAAVKYLRAREKALRFTNRDESGKIVDDTTETGMIGKEVLASIYFLSTDNEHELHVLTQDYEYDYTRCLAGGNPIHGDMVLHTLYVEHRRLTSEYFAPPKMKEDEAWAHADPLSASELEGYIESIPPKLVEPRSLSIAVPEKAFAGDISVTPEELDGLYFLFEKGPEVLSGWIDLEAEGYERTFVALRLEAYRARFATWCHSAVTPTKHLRLSKIDFGVAAFIREKREAIEKIYTERRKVENGYGRSDCVEAILLVK
jgi:hypothetical protein